MTTSDARRRQAEKVEVQESGHVAGFEPAEVSHAKDIVLYQIERLVDKEMLDAEIDQIGWADAIVEALLRAGAELPAEWASAPAPWDRSQR